MILWLLGCRQLAGNADDACAWQYAVDAVDPAARTVGTRLADGDQVVRVQLRWPEATPAEDERRPVSVVVHGGWEDGGAFLGPDLVALDLSPGLASVHLDLPGGGESTGTSDRRGPTARSAVATALRYAAGLAGDLDGCTIEGRVPAADPADVHVVGLSNGGNLAAATLADPDLDVPAVRGLVFWETPAGSPFATVAHGNDPTVYEPGACALDEDSVARCDYPLESLVADAARVCFDLDGDAACGDADVEQHGVVDPGTARRMLDPAIAAELEARGSLPADVAGAEAAEAWWAERDAARAAPALVAAHPDLPVILVASEEDHVLAHADHPHVYALGEALQRAGVAWSRLNPGVDHLPAVGERENDPNASMSLSDPDLGLLTEDAENPLGAALSAAVLELSERGVGGR
ncbi:MAG: alpha/beta hydrolase family protein [Myxococcota bacterium]